jgi:hypothetical protein
MSPEATDIAKCQIAHSVVDEARGVSSNLAGDVEPYAPRAELDRFAFRRAHFAKKNFDARLLDCLELFRE